MGEPRFKVVNRKGVFQKENKGVKKLEKETRGKGRSYLALYSTTTEWNKINLNIVQKSELASHCVFTATRAEGCHMHTIGR